MYSGPGVLDRKRDNRIFTLARYHPNLLCGRGPIRHCFDPILDYVQDYLLELNGVSHYLRKVLLKLR